MARCVSRARCSRSRPATSPSCPPDPITRTRSSTPRTRRSSTCRSARRPGPRSSSTPTRASTSRPPARADRRALRAWAASTRTSTTGKGSPESRRARHADQLGRESLAPPAVAVAAIAQPVVQAGLPPLPELPRLGLQAIAAPVRRPRRLEHVPGAVARCIREQRRARLDHLALRRGPGADARIERPRIEIGVGLGIAHLLDGALDADDALELDPVELQRSERMDRQLAALPALVVGEPD